MSYIYIELEGREVRVYTDVPHARIVLADHNEGKVFWIPRLSAPAGILKCFNAIKEQILGCQLALCWFMARFPEFDIQEDEDGSGSH